MAGAPIDVWYRFRAVIGEITAALLMKDMA
jgi:hypothetical protein